MDKYKPKSRDQLAEESKKPLNDSTNRATYTNIEYAARKNTQNQNTLNAKVDKLKRAFPDYDEEVIVALMEQGNGDAKEVTRALLEMYNDSNPGGDFTDSQR
jgi:hypothetical protein